MRNSSNEQQRGERETGTSSQQHEGAAEEEETETMKAMWVLGLLLLVLRWGSQQGSAAATAAASLTAATKTAKTSDLRVPITLIHSAAAKGAVCLDGSPPGYHLHPGSGSGRNNWLVDLEGGGWCHDVSNCLARRKTRLGSSKFMKKKMLFAGILSDNPQLNPDFYNWNRVRVRYCDGASFAGEGHDEARGLYFRGQRIFSAAMEELMSKGMKSANKVLLTGCSAGGLASILHCDEFRDLFPSNTTVKCLADAGLFLDVTDVSGERTLRNLYKGVVNLQGVASNLPATCTAKMDADLCFFLQNLLGDIQTPIFLLNSAYDGWQLQTSLAPKNADPAKHWTKCIHNCSKCSADEIELLQGFRNQMLDTVKEFSTSNQNGLFINSCFAHCQSVRRNTWHGDNAPAIENKGIAKSVSDWYFDRAQVKAIDLHTCNNTSW